MSKGGNPGYGKSEFVRQNIDKFSPLFWDLMEKYARSKDQGRQRFFMTEFNKLQAKMMPTEVTGKDGQPLTIEVVNYADSTQLRTERLPKAPIISA